MKKTIQAFLLDMDGVLFQGDRALPYADVFMAAIDDYPYRFITNNPVLSPQDVADKLRRLNIIETKPECILTSAQATAEWLAGQKPGFHYFAIGGRGLHQALSVRGVPDGQSADYVVVGEGALDYHDLVTGINLILKQGATLIGTNPDNSVDGSENGRHVVLPGGGALIAPFSVATGQQPTIIGKPEPWLYRIALQHLGVAAQDCLMIGDRPDTDILGAQRLGMKTALVRTGRFGPQEALPAEVYPPDFDVNNLAELINELGLCRN